MGDIVDSGNEDAVGSTSTPITFSDVLEVQSMESGACFGEYQTGVMGTIIENVQDSIIAEI